MLIPEIIVKITPPQFRMTRSKGMVIGNNRMLGTVVRERSFGG